jgi:hypothetical protein
MIDVLINETGGLIVAHNRKDLDDVDACILNVETGDLVLTGPGGLTVSTGRLAPSMIDITWIDMPGRIVRTRGHGVVRAAPMKVDLVGNRAR